MSQTATLAFLAVWHGWHAGYYVTFFNEFIVISFEKDFSTVWNKSVRVARYHYQSFSKQTRDSDNKISGGRSIQLTPLSPPPLAGKRRYILTSCMVIFCGDANLYFVGQVLCALFPSPMFSPLPTSWLESLLASLPGEPECWLLCFAGVWSSWLKTINSL